MNWLDVYDAFLCALVVCVTVKLLKKYVWRPKVWVLDDSEVDLSLFKLRIKLDRDYDLRYFTCPREMRRAYMISNLTFNEPACVIVDYFLGKDTTGDRIVKFFKANGIPATIMTGYEGEISDISSKDIIIKSPDDSFKRQVEDWVFSVTGRKAQN